MLSPPSRHGCGFSAFEDRKIVRFLCERDAWELVRGNKIWQIMEQAKICPERSFHSLRNRFLKSIMMRLESDYNQILQEYRTKLPSFLDRRSKVSSRALNVTRKKTTIQMPKDCNKSHCSGTTHVGFVDDDGWIETHTSCLQPEQVARTEKPVPVEPVVPAPAPTESFPEPVATGSVAINEPPASQAESQNSSFCPSQQWEQLRAMLIPLDKHPELIILSPTKKTPEKSPVHESLLRPSKESVKHPELITLLPSEKTSEKSLTHSSTTPSKDGKDLILLPNSGSSDEIFPTRRNLFQNETRTLELQIELDVDIAKDSSEIESLTPDGICPNKESLAKVDEPSTRAEIDVEEMEVIAEFRIPQAEDSPHGNTPPPDKNRALHVTRRGPSYLSHKKRNTSSIRKLLQISKIGRKLYNRNQSLMAIIGNFIIMSESNEEKQIELARKVSRRDATLRNYLMTNVLHGGNSTRNN